MKANWCGVIDGNLPEVMCCQINFDWNSYVDLTNLISIPLHLENNSDIFRSRLLKLLADIGSSEVSGKTISEHLEITTGFSLWSMSLIVEKSFQKSPRLFDCLRLLALEDLLSRYENIEGVIYMGKDNTISKSIELLCRQVSLRFAWNKKFKSQKNSLRINWLKKIYLQMPSPILGLILITRYVYARRDLNSAFKQLRDFPQGNISIFSYFIHLNKEKCLQGIFSSRHWGTVTELLNRNSGGANWYHIFLQSTDTPSQSVGISWLNKFNLNSKLNGHHAFIDSCLSANLVLRVIKRFIALNQVASKLKALPNIFVTDNLPIWIYYILESDIMDSINGRTAAQNLIWYELFNSAIGSLPKQRLGLYLAENQGWEKAMIHAWKKYGHGELIGVAHSSIRYWDLRYFDDPSLFYDTKYPPVPMPDKIAVNGPIALKNIIDAEYPLNRLVYVEAQRYINPIINNHKKKINLHSATFQKLDKKKKLLVLGDLLKDNCHEMLSLLQSCHEYLNKHYLITIKSHPGYQIKKKDYPFLHFELTDEPLHKIAGQFDVAFASNATSAALDALLAGTKVVVHLISGVVNLSPLRSFKGVAFVSTSDALQKSLFDSAIAVEIDYTSDYFWLDPSLPKWCAAINQSTSIQSPISNN